MTRAEWTRQQGDDVKALVGTFVRSTRPTMFALRLNEVTVAWTSSRPVQLGWEANVRYQVKRHGERLDGGQKSKIEASLEKLIGTADAEGWKISQPASVMPVNPTNNQIDWFGEFTQDSEFACEINGLIDETHSLPGFRTRLITT